MQQIGKFLIIAGILLVITGILFYLGGNKLNWIGRLPGDIRIEKENFSFYFPVTTMILFSIVLSLVIWIIKKLF